MTLNYDIVVLGGGTGGYVAAIRASQLGKKVALVERDKLGGTCLHRGCIPSKALLRSAEVYATLKESEKFGVTAGQIGLDFAKVLERKSAIVEQLHKGVQYLMGKHKIDIYNGIGRIIGPSIFSPRSGTVSVEKPDGEIETLIPQQLIIATGSRPRSLPGLHIDGQYVMSSDDIMRMEQLPKSVVIVGGGVIGVEWASMLSDFGVQVTVVEYAEHLVPNEDADISKELRRLLARRGVEVLTQAKVLSETVTVENGAVSLQVEHRGELKSLAADKVLVSVGRQANVEGMGIDNTDIQLDNGFIRVNPYMQTAESHIYAIGDVNGGIQLAHAASHEGIVAVEHICGLKPEPYAPHLIPRCVYTRPEIASVGWNEQQAKARGFEIKTGKFSFKPLGKALVYGENDGFVKVIADKQTNDILGVHIIGPHATEAIAEAALAQLLNATPWEVGRTIHPHPTLSESLAEAMLDVDGLSLHG